MWRSMLGDFDVDGTLRKPSSVAMYVFFQIVVVVLLKEKCDESDHCHHGRCEHAARTQQRTGSSMLSFF